MAGVSGKRGRSWRGHGRRVLRHCILPGSPGTRMPMTPSRELPERTSCHEPDWAFQEEACSPRGHASRPAALNCLVSRASVDPRWRCGSGRGHRAGPGRRRVRAGLGPTDVPQDDGRGCSAQAIASTPKARPPTCRSSAVSGGIARQPAAQDVLPTLPNSARIISGPRAVRQTWAPVINEYLNMERRG